MAQSVSRRRPDRGRAGWDQTGAIGTLHLSVTDSGVGITPPCSRNVFDLFTQGHAARGDQQAGLGIGLALARRLVEMHEGEIAAESEGPGRGSSFAIRLPITMTLPDRRSTLTGAQVPETKRRVVVIDDNQDAADAIAMLLGALGHECRVAYDGESGLMQVLDFLDPT